MERSSFKFLSLFLSFLMCIYLIPTSVLAEAFSADTGNEIVNDTIDAENALEETVFEVTELREESVKHFRLPDGTFVAAQYNNPVHYLDENGKWQDIDNTLTDSGSDISTSNAKIKFAKHIPGNENVFTLQNDNYKITMSLEGAIKKTKGVATNTVTEFDESATVLQKKMTLDKLTSRVMYTDILDGVDLEYVLTSGSIKENIIVKEKADEYAYTFTLKLNNLTAVLDDSGGVIISKKDGTTVYSIPAPIVFDADGEYAEPEDAVYTLTSLGSGKYSLTVTVSSTWMNAEERAFPVTVDPTLKDYSYFTMSDTYINSGSPDDTFTSNAYLYLGNRSNQTQYVLMMLQSINGLPVGSKITKLTLELYLNKKSISKDRKLYARRVTSTHNTLAGISWNTGVTASDEIYDYTTVGVNDTENTYTLDLTQMYYDWERTGDSKIVHISLESNTSREYVVVSSEEFSSSTKPKFTVEYINTLGIEDYFSYSTHSVGDAGSTHINLNTGNVILGFTDTVSDNTALSVSVGHVYNSALASDNYTVKRVSDEVNYFSNMKFGKGFNLSVQQVLQVKTIDTASFAVYHDGDGTEHYFIAYYILDGTVYFKDTEGIGLKVCSPSSSVFSSEYSFFADLGFTCGNSLIMEDIKGNRMLYYNGLPAVYADLNGNIVKYLYNTTTSTGTSWFPQSSGNQLRGIVQQNAKGVDSSGKIVYTDTLTVATFNYNSSYYLTSIVTPGKTINYGYTNNCLTSISVDEYLNSSTSSQNSSVAQYTYTSNGKLTDAYDPERKYGVHYDYDTNGRCTGFYEFAGTVSSKTVGAEYVLEYDEGQTTLTSLGATDSALDDIHVTNVFDNLGRTICAYTKDGGGNVISSSSGSYYNKDDFSNNKIASSSSIGTTVSNLLGNNSFEASTALSGWTVSGTGISFATNYVRTGSKSAKMNASESSETAVSLSKNVTGLSAGEHYFSVYVNTSALSAAEGGVCLKVEESGTVVASSKTYNGNIGYTDSAISSFDSDGDQWHRISVKFTAQAGEQYTLKISASKFVGSIYVDDAQLERSSVLSEYNLLNANIKSTSTAGWTLSSSAEAYSSDSLHPVGCYKISGTWDSTVHLTQTVNINNSQKGYTLSAWAKAVALPETKSATRSFRLKAVIKYTDSSNDDETVYIPFNTSYSGWQYVSGTVMPGLSAEVKSITVSFDYANNCNTAYLAGISLVESNASGYEYDKNGNLKGVSKSGLVSTTYDYDDDEYGTKIMLGLVGSIRSSITYENANNAYLPTSVTSDGIITEYTYDRAGNVTGTVIRSSKYSNLKITSSTTFDSKLSKLQTSTNELGTVTSYTYNTDGSVSSETVDGIETEYEYTKKDRYSRVFISGKASTYYSYSNGNLSNITVGGISSSGSLLSYNFTYDAFGRTTSIKVMSQTLASYVYEAKTGLLLSTHYGNGYEVYNSYDNLGRLMTITHNDTLAYSYEYGGNGSVSVFTDHINGAVYYYDYDSNGNTLSEEKYDSSDNFLQGSYYSYNSYGDVESVVLKVGNNVIRYVCEYGYDVAVNTGSETSVNSWKSKNSGYRVDHSYDDLNRSKYDYLRADAGSAAVLTRNYSYLTTSSGQTSLVSGITYSGIASKAYLYTYDALGNITSVSRNGVLEASYEYDDLGQLKKEINNVVGKTWEYTYDDRGNLLSKKEKVGSSTTAKSYTYFAQFAAEAWNDCVRTYNGSAAFTYDAIGNPLSYNNGSTYTFTWQNGRQLASATVNGVTSNYTYNSDGLRTRKVVGNKVYDYYWFGSQLAMMTITEGSNVITMKFYYDDNGRPMILDSNDTKYFYVTNLQGDVVSIVSTSGEIGSYSYDAWGNPISTGSSAILQNNPLRYRGYIYDTETGFYYLQSRYYDPVMCRFINADGYVSTGTGFLGYNMYAYCNNNPVMYLDKTGSIHIAAVIGLILVAGLVISIPSSEDQTSQLSQDAAEKYNSDTVNVYKENVSGSYDPTKFNTRFYIAKNGLENIDISKSLSIKNEFEMEAFLDVIINSPYYSEEKFGTRQFMKAQWIAHNYSYYISSNSLIGYYTMKFLSDSDDPIVSSRTLDLRSRENLSKKQKLIYTIISWLA